ncbi:MAG TPA: hypothetical protein VN456_17150 [Desulfosporosinus sp.]|nr:hypothetical protein [Desulfosporosinus sp.]
MGRRQARDDALQEMTHYLKQLIQIDTLIGRHGETVAAHYIRPVMEANALLGTMRTYSGKRLSDLSQTR